MMTIREVISSNVSFHDNLLVTHEENRGWLNRIKDFSYATIKEITSRWQRRYNPLKVRVDTLFPALQEDTGSYDVDVKQWRTSSKLIVLIHGLNSSPLAWSNYLETLSSDPTTSSFIPFVYKKGYCKCKEAAQPILNVVQEYANQNPNHPIFLIGHSNGARIAAYIEQKLIAKDIRLISIAGPHCGSRLINWINRLGLTRRFRMTSKMVEELTYQGDWATKKLIKWHNQQQDKNVERIFFASSDDWRIFPNETSFPNLPNSRFYLVDGESHVTIIDAVREKVLSYI